MIGFLTAMNNNTKTFETIQTLFKYLQRILPVTCQNVPTYTSEIESEFIFPLDFLRRLYSRHQN